MNNDLRTFFKCANTWLVLVADVKASQQISPMIDGIKMKTKVECRSSRLKTLLELKRLKS